MTRSLTDEIIARWSAVVKREVKACMARHALEDDKLDELIAVGVMAVLDAYDEYYTDRTSPTFEAFVANRVRAALAAEAAKLTVSTEATATLDYRVGSTIVDAAEVTTAEGAVYRIVLLASADGFRVVVEPADARPLALLERARRFADEAAARACFDDFIDALADYSKAN